MVEQREPVECSALSPRDLHDVSSSSGAECGMEYKNSSEKLRSTSVKSLLVLTVFCKCSAAHSVCWDLYRSEIRFLFQLISSSPLHGEEETPEERFVLRAHLNNTEGNTAAAVTPHQEPRKTHVCHFPSSLFLKSPLKKKKIF